MLNLKCAYAQGKDERSEKERERVRGVRGGVVSGRGWGGVAIRTFLERETRALEKKKKNLELISSTKCT